MPKLTLIGLYFWICLAQKVVSGEDLYHKVGGELALKLDKSTVPDSITSILWKHGKNKVAEWDKDFGGSLDIYAAFKKRTTLDQNTGELRINGLMTTDIGVYSVEFNSKLLDKTYKLSVIKAVPKPTITSSCNANLTSCTLTCEGDTTDAEPVTYNWKVGEGAWEVGGKLFNVFKSDTGKSTNGYKYICKLNNAVSGEVSEPVGEVFGPEPSNTSAIVGGVIVTILVLVAVITGILIWEKKTEYSQDTWIEFFSKFFSRLCVKSRDGNNQTTAKVSDGVQPEQETVRLLPVKTGNDDADKLQGNGAAEISGSSCPKDESKPEGSGVQPEQVGESKTDGSAAPVGEDESKMDGSTAPVGEDESKTDGSTAPVGEDESKTDGSTAPVGEDGSKTDGSTAPVGEDGSKTDGSAAPGGDLNAAEKGEANGGESKTDGSAAPVGEDESKTDGSTAPVGEDESKTDGSTAPVGEDGSKTDGSAAPGGDLNAAEKGEANGEVSVLLNEDEVKHDNGEGAAEENSAL
ncbi:uncharacterized protein LOC120033359 isoform X2 [Salvelinus namaycush]|uniref:Uncharacterized protein LOC120033359 isoform X2 n=1 Tax=Salvelinus namaycush TaxID=8040 RepID=A0A8U0Q3Q3_SALNM|nr:uncharacterized protein LOC120033359 isoform X2 [Salvelinus namaycush]